MNLVDKFLRRKRGKSAAAVAAVKGKTPVAPELSSLPEGWTKANVKEPCLALPEFQEAKQPGIGSFGGENWSVDRDVQELQYQLRRYGGGVVLLNDSSYTVTDFIAKKLYEQVYGNMPISPYRFKFSLEHILAALAMETRNPKSQFGFINSPDTLYTVQRGRSNGDGVVIVQHPNVLAAGMPKSVMEAYKLFTERPRKTVGLVSAEFWRYRGGGVFTTDVMPFLKVATTASIDSDPREHTGASRYLPIVGFRDTGKPLEEVLREEAPSTPLARGYEPWDGSAGLESYLKQHFGEELVIITNAGWSTFLHQVMQELNFVVDIDEAVYTHRGQPKIFGTVKGVDNILTNWFVGKDLPVKDVKKHIGSDTDLRSVYFVTFSENLGRDHVMAIVGLLNEAGAAVKLYMPSVGHFVPVNGRQVANKTA